MSLLDDKFKLPLGQIASRHGENATVGKIFPHFLKTHLGGWIWTEIELLAMPRF